MRWVRDFWHYYSQTFICMVILDIFLVGVIVFLLIENNEQRKTNLKLRLEINDLKYRAPKQELRPRIKFSDYLEYELRDSGRDRMR